MAPLMALVRGEVSLRRAVWIYGVAGSLVLALPVNIATTLGGTSLDSVMAIYCLVFLTYVVFAMIGIWRSATRYSGFVFWPWISKFSVAVVAAGAIAGFLQGFSGGGLG